MSCVANGLTGDVEMTMQITCNEPSSQMMAILLRPDRSDTLSRSPIKDWFAITHHQWLHCRQNTNKVWIWARMNQSSHTAVLLPQCLGITPTPTNKTTQQSVPSIGSFHRSTIPSTTETTKNHPFGFLLSLRKSRTEGRSFHPPQGCVQ